MENPINRQMEEAESAVKVVLFWKLAGPLCNALSPHQLCAGGGSAWGQRRAGAGSPASLVSFQGDSPSGEGVSVPLSRF